MKLSNTDGKMIRFVLFMSGLACWIIASPAQAAEYSGGAGIEGDPYLIATPSDLLTLANPANSGDWDKHFLMANDVDMEGVSFSPIAPDMDFNPNEIWYQGTPFSGVFDGDGHVIRHLVIHTPDKDFVGMFAFVENAQIKNLGLESCTVFGNRYVGGLVGFVMGGTVINCYSVGSITGNMWYAGGLIGENFGTVEACFASGAVTGIKTNVGGLVGRNSDTVTTCYSTGSVTSNSSHKAGGLVGENYGTITACYSAGIVCGEVNGGLIGYSFVVLDPFTFPTIDKSVWDMETSGQTGSSGGKGLTTAQMKTVSFFQNAGWHAYEWVMEEGQYPRLPWENTGGGAIPPPETIPLAGSGTEGDPYQVGTPLELALLSWHSELLDKHISLTSDLDCAGTTLCPIGVLGPFTGTFEGNSHVIQNAVLEYPDSEWVGLFANLYPNGKIQNLGLVNCHVRGRDYTGCLVGGAVVAAVDNCYAVGTAAGMNAVGGLIGGTVYVDVKSCHAACETTGTTRYIGGLVGYLSEGIMNKCRATGNVFGYREVGGLCGNIVLLSGQVSDAYALGSVHGTNSVGGLAGNFEYYGGAPDPIRNTFAAGAVRGSVNIGGLFGKSNGGIVSSFWDSTVGGPDNGIGVGLPTEQMKQRSTFEGAGWDFGVEPPVWSIFEGRSYPYLAGLPVPLSSIDDFEMLTLDNQGAFFLTCDIDARNTQLWSDKNAHSGFPPICTSTAPFSGTLNGYGHRILGLHIYRPEQDNTGFFSAIGPDGKVSGVGLESLTVTGRNQTGGLAGLNDGRIEQCYAQGSVSGVQETGGLIGNNSGTVFESYAAVTLEGALLGGLVGLDNGGSVNASFWDALLSGVLTSGGGTGLQTSAMQLKETYTAENWNMDQVWDIVQGQSYPHFRNSRPLRIVEEPPQLIDADTVNMAVESFVPDVFVSVGGGLYPVWRKISAVGQDVVSIPLKQEASNRLVLSVLSETGEERVMAYFTVHESAAFPSVPSDLRALELFPPTVFLAENSSQEFLCIATFADNTTADITQVAGYNKTGGFITGGGLYTHDNSPSSSVQSLFYTDQGWRYSNVVIITSAKSDSVKSGTGLVSGVIRSHYTGLGIPQSKITSFNVFTSGVSGQYEANDSLGNYAFYMPENIYHFEASYPGFCSEMLEGGVLIVERNLLNPGPPALYSDPYYSGQIKSDVPLEYNFALRPNDAQAPWVYYVEPPADCTVNVPQLVVTAINADKYSELEVATFTLNANTHDILDHISSTGFYRNTWPLELGLNVLHLHTMDTEGNAAERTLMVTYDPEHDPSNDELPPPDGPPATACVDMAIVNLRDGMAVRGNAVTLLAEPVSGDLDDVDAVSFEVRAGTSSAWQMLETTFAAPHAARWDTSLFAAGSYQVRAVAISKDGCVDSAAAAVTVSVSSGASYNERVVSGTHTLSAPVSAASDTVLALRDGERFARILLPAGAVASNDALTAFFPAASGFNPTLTSRQRDAGLYLNASLSAHTGDLLNGKRATLEIGYADADGDDLVDDSSLRAAWLKVAHLPAPTSAFSLLPVSTLKRPIRCIAGETTHFSVFGVIEEQPAPALNVTTESLSNGTVGAAYSETLEASGGVSPYAWSCVSGTLPDGLSINNGVLEGMPTAAGEYTFTLQAADAQSTPYTAPRQFTVAVFDASQPTVTVTRAAGQSSVVNALPLNWDIVFSESVSGFTEEDISLTGTAASGAVYSVSGSGANYTLAITALTYDGTLTPRIPSNAATNGFSGNGASSNEEPIWVDRKAPLAVIACSYPGAQTAGGTPVAVASLPIAFPLVFDATVTGLAAADITFVETIANLAFSVQGSGKQYTILVTQADPCAGMTPKLAADAVFDGAGNGNAETLYAGRTIQYAPDTRCAVTLNQRSTQADPTQTFPIYYDIVFSQVVTGFETGDVVYISGTGSALSPVYVVSGSGANYTLTVSNAVGDGRLAFYIPADVVVEGNQASTSLDNGVTLNTGAPGIELGAPSAARTVQGPVSIPVLYSNAKTVSLNAGNVVLVRDPTVQVGTIIVTGTGTRKRTITLLGISGYGNLAVRLAAGTAVNAVGNAAPEAGPSATIQVGGPTADFSATPTAGKAPLEVTFSDESDSGALPLEAWHWDFGDGETSDEAAPTYTYETPGVYTVSLTVTSTGASDTATKTGYIQVLNAIPVGGRIMLLTLAALLSIMGIFLIKQSFKRI